jgi:hypothetical protein
MKTIEACETNCWFLTPCFMGVVTFTVRFLRHSNYPVSTPPF